MLTDYEKSSDKSHVTALSAEEWASLRARNQGLYVVVQTVRADPAARWVSKPADYATACRIFGQIIDGAPESVYTPPSPVSMRVMSVSEWTRVGAR